MATEKNIFQRFPKSAPLEKVRDMVRGVEGFRKCQFFLEAGNVTYRGDPHSVNKLKDF